LIDLLLDALLFRRLLSFIDFFLQGGHLLSVLPGLFQKPAILLTELLILSLQLRQLLVQRRELRAQRLVRLKQLNPLLLLRLHLISQLEELLSLLLSLLT